MRYVYNYFIRGDTRLLHFARSTHACFPSTHLCNLQNLMPPLQVQIHKYVLPMSLTCSELTGLLT